MAAIERILERLERHPELTYRVSGRMIVIDRPTADGFEVGLSEGPGEWVVFFEGWHDHFRSEDEALNCFVDGLSDRCRLRIDLRGSFAYRWTLEERTDHGWLEESETGLLFFPFWRPRRVEYRQNAVILDP